MIEAVVRTLESWTRQIAELGAFTPQEHKDEYLLITEFLYYNEEDSFSMALRTCRDYSLKESMDPNVLKELINATLKPVNEIMTMTQIDHRTIIALSSVKGVGPVKLRKMISQIQDNNVRIETWEDLYDFLMEYAPTSVKVSDDLAEDAFRRASRILSESKRLGIGVLTYFDTEYPENLRNTVSEDGKTTPPMILYYMGNLDALKRPAMAIIGTRHPTAKGVQAGEFISKAVASLGYNIVSGLAIGCDTLGHKGALDVRGTTTAFLAHGLDTIYPQENEGLAKRIVENGGLLLSEYPTGTTCNAYRLVERDRLQAGLADATVVIQTGIKGGTMHAVRATQKAGKGLYAISYGEPDRSHVNVAGNAMLINQGATPVYQNSDMNTLFQPKKRIEKQLNLFSDD